MDDFIENIYLVLPALRYDFFTENARDYSMKLDLNPIPEATYFVTNVPEIDLQARAKVVDGQFIVEAGSYARSSWIGVSEHHIGYEALFNSLLDQGVLSQNDDHCIFVQSYRFNSPSAAGAVIKGRPTAGPTTWRVEGTRETYKDWEADQIQMGAS